MQRIPKPLRLIGWVAPILVFALGCEGDWQTLLLGPQNESDSVAVPEDFPNPDTPDESETPSLKEQGIRIEGRSAPLEPSQVQATDVVGSNLGTGQGSGSQAETKAVAASDAKVEQILTDLNAETTSEGILINLPENILFDFDQANLKPAAKPTLEKINKLLTYYQNAPMAINGHTDSKGSNAYNQTLSEKRANAVKTYLVSNFGVSSSRLQAKGYGETKPVAANTKPNGSDNPSGRQENRRVEVIIENQ